MSYLDGNPYVYGAQDPAAFIPRTRPTYNGPGIFQLSNNRDRATAEMGAYGIDLSQGNPYGEFAAQSRGPGLGAQTAAMEMYRQSALGLRPSLAELQTANAMGSVAGSRAQAAGQVGGGNAAAQLQAINSGAAGMQANAANAGGLGRLQEMGAAQQGYAGLGTQLVSQGLQYDQLAAQRQAQAAEDQMRMYLGARGLDQEQRNINRNFALNVAQGVVGAAGGMAQAGSTIGSSIEYNPDGTRKY